MCRKSIFFRLTAHLSLVGPICTVMDFQVLLDDLEAGAVAHAHDVDTRLQLGKTQTKFGFSLN